MILASTERAHAKSRIVFMGSSEFACPAMRALSEAGHDIACVYTRPARGRAAKRTPVARWAQAHGCLLRCPDTLRADDETAALVAFAPDIIVVAAYGLILPQAVLDIPGHGCLNIHASALPRWRGAAPIARAIMAGDVRTGVCIMRMDAGLDTGAVLSCQHEPICPTDSCGDLQARLADSGARLIVEAVAAAAQGRAIYRDQPCDGVTYAQKILPGETRIDWNRPAIEVRNHIHGLSPEPGTWCMDPAGQRLRLLAAVAEVHTDIIGPPGTLLDDRLCVACGRGAVRATRVQRAGSRILDARDFLNGARLAARMHLS